MTRQMACYDCGRPATGDMLRLSVEASPGFRERDGGQRYVSTRATITRGVFLCDGCLFAPEWVPMLAIISDPRARPTVDGDGQCIVLCRRREPSRLRRWVRLRTDSGRRLGVVECPMCAGKARGWAARQAPLAVQGAAGAAVSSRRGLRELALDLWWGTDSPTEPAAVEPGQQPEAIGPSEGPAAIERS